MIFRLNEVPRVLPTYDYEPPGSMSNSDVISLQYNAPQYRSYSYWYGCSLLRDGQAPLGGAGNIRFRIRSTFEAF
jgi:hypothetical protein